MSERPRCLKGPWPGQDLNNKRGIALTLINLGDVGRYQADHSGKASFVGTCNYFENWRQGGVHQR
jgi:hypothetical protein